VQGRAGPIPHFCTKGKTSPSPRPRRRGSRDRARDDAVVYRPAIAGLCYNHRMTTYTQKIIFGEMRASGVRNVDIYCRDHRCSHHVEANADGWPDDVRLSDVEPSFTFTRCGKKGAEVRPKFSHAGMGTG
jgi:hypothetical protein